MCPTLSRAASRAAAFDVGRWLQAGRTQRWGRRGREGPPDRRHERGHGCERWRAVGRRARASGWPSSPGERLRAVVSARPSSPGERLAVKPGRTPQPGTLCGHPNARHAHRRTKTWPGALNAFHAGLSGRHFPFPVAEQAPTEPISRPKGVRAPGTAEIVESSVPLPSSERSRASHHMPSALEERPRSRAAREEGPEPP